MDFYVHLVGLVSFIWQFRLKCQSQINQNDASIRTAEKDEEILKMQTVTSHDAIVVIYSNQRNVNELVCKEEWISHFMRIAQSTEQFINSKIVWNHWREKLFNQ